MRRLLRGLHSDPASYDSHPLAAREFTDALTANLEVPVPPELRPREIGAWEIVRALGLLTLDGLQSQLSQSEPDEQLTLGLIIAWSKDIQPLVDGVSDKFPSYKQIISEYRSLTTLGNLLGELPQVADWPITQFKWITGTFSKMYGSATGERKAGYYREDALRYLLRRIERAAARSNRRVKELLPELVGARPQAPGVTPGVVPDWATRLSQCAADYRSYELREIGRLLGEQGRTASFDWFLARQVHRPADQSEGGDGAHIARLTDICRPGTQTALLDHRGSGTTTALLWLSSQYCTDAADVEPVILRLDAKEYFYFNYGSCQ